MTNDETYVWDLVQAATALPLPAVPLAAGLVAANHAAMPDEIRSCLLALLGARTDVSPSPAQESLVAAWRMTLDATVPGSIAQASPHWQALCALRQDGHAAAALRFMLEIAQADSRRWERAGLDGH